MIEKLIELLSEVKEDKSIVKNATAETSIVNDIALDSLQMINLILKVEDEFNIEIDFEDFDFEYLNSIQEFGNYISSKL